MQSRLPASGFQPRRILVRGVNWLGDAVMTTPALVRLRERFPNAHITLLTPEKLADLWREHPAVDDLMTLAASESIFTVARRIKRFSAGRELLKGYKRGFKEYMEGQTFDEAVEEVGTSIRQAVECIFDVALVLPNSPRAALEVWLARVPHRIGYARPWRNCFLTQAVPPRADAVKMRKLSVAEIRRRTVVAPVSKIISEKSETGATPVLRSAAHQIHEYLHLAAVLGANPEPLAPQLFVAPAEIEAAEEKFALDKTANPILGLNPGAEYGPAKRWPADRFIAAAIEIQRRTNCRWLILGGKRDTEIAASITGRIQSAIGNRQLALNLAGQTSLRELCALLKLCRVLLTNDSGPMHIAAAVGTPVVVPFGSTSPELTGPGLPDDSRHRLLTADAACAPCFRRVCPIDFRCMMDIPAERVVAAVLAVLSEHRDAS